MASRVRVMRPDGALIIPAATLFRYTDRPVLGLAPGRYTARFVIGTTLRGYEEFVVPEGVSRCEVKVAVTR